MWLIRFNKKCDSDRKDEGGEREKCCIKKTKANWLGHILRRNCLLGIWQTKEKKGKEKKGKTKDNSDIGYQERKLLWRNEWIEWSGGGAHSDFKFWICCFVTKIPKNKNYMFIQSIKNFYYFFYEFANCYNFYCSTKLFVVTDLMMSVMTKSLVEQ